MYTNIKSFEAACKDQKKKTNLPDYSKCEMTPAEERYNLAIFQAMRISVSINKENGKEWKPKPTDPRYYCYLWIQKDGTKRFGFGLSLDAVVCDYSFTNVASRLVFRDRPRAEFFFKQYPELCEDIFIFQT